MAALCVGVYFGSSYILNIKNTKEQIAANNVDKISNYLDSKKYKDLTATQKIELLNLLKQSLNDYPRIFSGDTKFEYITLDTSIRALHLLKRFITILVPTFSKIQF